MSEKKKVISVMIPTYNEEENARPIYEAVRDEIRKDCPDYDYEILFIDNKSQDRTRRIITDICAQDPKVKAIFNSKNFGQFNSPYYGMIHTTGDCTITICADFQDPVEMIPKFVAEWEKGYKIVIGKKTTSQENPVMYFLRDCYYKTIKKMSNVEMIEQFTGFGLYDKSFIQTLRDLHDPPRFCAGLWRSLAPSARRLNTPSPSAGQARPTTIGTACLMPPCSALPATPRLGCGWRSSSAFSARRSALSWGLCSWWQS